MRRIGWLTMAPVVACLTLGACDGGDRIGTSDGARSLRPAVRSAA